MKNKKLLSTLMAGALAVSQMGIPAMAAGGSLDVDVTTKTAIIRVAVPTSMEIAVNQFEIDDAGSQIYSSDFTIGNKSEVPVKVAVDSTATLAASNAITLVSTKDAAGKSTNAAGEAWLAAAAQISSGSYVASDKTIADLDDTSQNVATFDASSKEASQTFYLAKSTGDAEYKLLYPSEAGKVGDATYAEFYALTSMNTQPADETTLQTAATADDVYVVATADAAKNGSSVKKIAKGTTITSDDYNSNNTYYTASTTATAATDVAANTMYVYAGMDAEGGSTGFRYIGKLGEAKASWSSDDISKISIAYDITGLTEDSYTEADKNCVYGLYSDPTVPSIANTSYTLDEDTEAIEIKVSLGTGSKAASTVSSVKYGDTELIGSDGYATYSDGKITIDASIADILEGDGKSNTIKVTFDDPGKTSLDVTVTNNIAGSIFSAGAATGTVTYKTAKVKEVVSIKMTNASGEFDAMTATQYYEAATSTVSGDTTTITFDSTYCSYYSGNVEATIEYQDANGTSKTEKLTLEF